MKAKIMSWIILALTLGAAITSIIHGVFMLFGLLAVNSGTPLGLPLGLPPAILASLPLISAVFGLVGGIVAFNRNKWGALFLFIACGLCVLSRDTWIYGGIYFLAGLLCFALKRETEEYYGDMIYDDDNYNPEPEEHRRENYYYTPQEQEEEDFDVPKVQPLQPRDFPEIQNDELNFVNSAKPQLRRRMSKICPDCGAMLARDDKICPNCGARLSVPADASEPEEYQRVQQIQPSITEPEPQPDFQNEFELEPEAYTDSRAPKNFEIDLDSVKIPESGYSTQYSPRSEPETQTESGLNFNANDGDYMNSAQSVPNYRMVKPAKNKRDAAKVSKRNSYYDESYDNAASSYQQFSKYTRRAKKRKRSAGRRIMSMLLLVAGVGVALYFLLGLRKLPPGELPPIAVKEVKVIEQPTQTPPSSVPDEPVAQTVELASPSENILPNFTPERTPKNGMVVGSNVNVRADHSVNSSKITRLSVNSKVEVIGTFNVTSGQYQGIWYNIRTGGREGWIYGRYVQPLGSGLPTGYSSALMKSFGDNFTQLSEALGTPTRKSNTSAEWPGLTATLKGDDITRIRITSQNRELQNGLKVGMSQTALYQIMGYPSGVSNRILQYNEGSKTGLSVQLDRNNSVSSITVNNIR